ncbi:carboxypeptidase-like regulatory domain-containing protein [Sinomicrobium sp.]
MKTKLKIWVLVILILIAFSFDEEDNNLNDKYNIETGYARGKVVDTEGDPIAGAKIYLYNTEFKDSYLQATTKKDGTYKIKLHTGSWVAYACFKKEYNGETYSIQLYPDNNDSLSEEGGIRNFRWRLARTDPENEAYFYGGQLTVLTVDRFEDDYEDIELIFNPVGLLIDGSKGRKFRLKYGDPHWEEYGYIKDIPIGRYMLTAVLKKDSAEIPLSIQNWYTKGDFVSTFQLDFIPDNSMFEPVPEAAIDIAYNF